MNTLFKKINNNKNNFSELQNRISEYLLTNYKEAAFLNSTQLANKIGVSNPTIIRFATMLGYTGFPQFQEELQRIVSNELSSLDRLSYLDTTDDNDVTGSIFNLEISNMTSAYKAIDKSKLTQAIELIASSETVLIAGHQISESLAVFSHYTLSKIHKSVEYAKKEDLNQYKKIKNKKCCAIVFSFPRYPNETLKVMESLKKKEIPQIVITDSYAFPNCDLAHTLLLVPIKYTSFIDPISSVFCIINSMALEITKINKKEVMHNLEIFENYSTDNKIFKKNE